MKTLRALIVDDERLARQKLRTLLSAEDGIEITGECASAAEARAALSRARPDLLLLDVEMPGGGGFEVVKALRGAALPAVVFVTAHGAHAVKAFEVEAADYVLKPFDRLRLHEALQRARKRIEAGEAPTEERLLALVERVVAARDGREAKDLERFLVKAGEKTVLVPYAEVDWIEAEGKYVKLHARGAAHLVREAIGAVEERLDAKRFLRIHRGAIVNVARVAELHRGFAGALFVMLKDGTRLVMSRRYRARIREATGLDV